MEEVLPEKLHVFGKKNYMQDYLESSGARVIAAVGPIPGHIAFCMDGNRRFAKKEKLNEGAGHVAGFETMLRLLLACYRIGVKTVTVYAFSIENFNRSPQESDTLFDLVRTKLWNMVKNRDSAMRRLGWHIRFPGSRNLLAADLVERINEIETCTRDCHEMTVNICAPYTTRDDLAHALSVVSTMAPSSDTSSRSYAAKLSESRYMAPSEPLDIFVRTSGETRFSDFMCWEAASQCTFEFVPELWPELTVWRLYRIIAKWQVRKILGMRSKRPQPLDTLKSAPPLVSVSQKGKTKTEGVAKVSQRGTATLADASMAVLPAPAARTSHMSEDDSCKVRQVSAHLRHAPTHEPTHEPPSDSVSPSTVTAKLQQASIGESPAVSAANHVLAEPEEAPSTPETPVSNEEAPPLVKQVNDTRVYMLQFDPVPGASHEPRGGEETRSEEPHSEEPHSEEPHSEEPHSEEPHSEEPHSEEPHSEEEHNEEEHNESPHSAGTSKSSANVREISETVNSAGDAAEESSAATRA